VGNFDADTLADIAVVHPVDRGGKDAIDLFLSNGDGTFQLIGSLNTTVVGVRTLVAADLNGDTMVDLITANGSNASVSVFLGNGNGTFQAAQVSSLSLIADDLAVGDVDGDTVPDLVVIDTIAARFTILSGNGDGTFQELSTSVSTSSLPRDMKLADLNGDTLSDLIVVSGGLDAISIHLGTGSGFQPPQDSVVGAGPIAVEVRDVTGDAQLDLVVTHLSTNDVVVLPGNGDGTFQAPEVFATSIGGAPISVPLAVADFNGDTLPDIATTHDAANIVTILLHQ
jgi:hypothetical protein